MLAMQQYLFLKAMGQMRNAHNIHRKILYMHVNTHTYTHNINRKWGCAHMHQL